MNITRYWAEICKGYFEPEELLSDDGMKLFTRGHLVLEERALRKLVQFRIFMDVPFVVNSGENRRRGWRSSAENLRPPCRGRPYHPMGVAFDVTAKGVSSVELWTEARLFGFVGCGLYDTFVHVDMRPRYGMKKFIWDKRAGV